MTKKEQWLRVACWTPAVGFLVELLFKAVFKKPYLTDTKRIPRMVVAVLVQLASIAILLSMIF